MPVTGTNPRPSAAPSGALFGGGTGPARRRGRRTPSRVGDGSAARRLEIPPTPSGGPLAAGGQVRPETLRTRGLAAAGEDLLRQQPLQAREIAPEALPNRDSGTPCWAPQRTGRPESAKPLRRTGCAGSRRRTPEPGRRGERPEGVGPGMVSGPAFGSRGLHRVPCTLYVSWRESSRDETDSERKQPWRNKAAAGSRAPVGPPKPRASRPAAAGTTTRPRRNDRPSGITPTSRRIPAAVPPRGLRGSPGSCRFRRTWGEFRPCRTVEAFVEPVAEAPGLVEGGRDQDGGT